MTSRVHPRCDRCQASSQLKGTNSPYERARTRTNEYWRAPADNEVIHRNFSADPTNGASESSVDTKAARAPCPTRFVASRTAWRRVVRSSSTQSRNRAGGDRWSHLALTRSSTRSPALGRRRPSACAGQDQNQWRSITDDGVSGLRQAPTVGFSQPIFVADRPASTEPVLRKHLCSRRPRWHPGRPLGARPTPWWDFGRSHAAAVKGRFAGLRPPLTAADYLLETPAPYCGSPM